ncbi:MAG: helix-turn-helix domain-containing protein [Fimbriimonas sp.]
MKTNEFDPLAYIERAFQDQNGSAEDATAGNKKARFKKTVMSAPRPRRRRETPQVPAEQTIDPELQEVWSELPKNIEFLVHYYDDSVTANYYRGEFKETRQDLIRRLLDPELSLEETSRLLGVCPATVRRYTNRGWLGHHRTQGGQRRFRLSAIVKFVNEHGRFPDAA